ncbi:MAG: hypothetical protein D6737_00980 [Chloroflexi bacterium]|nr:MAG: hypothetical protein CUN54_00765 [Phototrophicales bacterium]RMF82707.1 MAG: hypothetical protein D6737_00980 [Chloroflexota bacterium]
MNTRQQRTTIHFNPIFMTSMFFVTLATTLLIYFAFSGMTGIAVAQSDGEFDPDLLARGEALFQREAGGIGCQYCHGQDARGDIGPNILGKSPEAILQAIGTVQMMEVVTDVTAEDAEALSIYLAFLDAQSTTSSSDDTSDTSQDGDTSANNQTIAIDLSAATGDNDTSGGSDNNEVISVDLGAATGNSASDSSDNNETITVDLSNLGRQDDDSSDAETLLEIDGDAENGAALFTANGCSACHNFDSDDALVGPGLLTIAERAALRVEGLDAVEYIRQSIVEPSAFVVEGFPPAMPPFTTLSEEEVNDLIAYLFTLNADAEHADNTDAVEPVATEEVSP